MTIAPRLILAFIICLMLLGANLHAQSAWLPPTERSSVSIELYRLDKTSISQEANGTTFFINARLKSNDEFALILDIPFSRSDKRPRFGILGSFIQSSQTVIGNPYIGISYKENKYAATTFDAGIRIPLAERGKSFSKIVGMQADYARLEAFSSDPVSLRVLIGGDWSSETSPHNGWIKGGGTLIIPDKGDNMEFIADFQSGIWYRGESVVFGFNLIGRSLLTEGNLSFSQRTEVLFGFGFTVNIGSFRPGIHGRVPTFDNGLANLGKRINSSFGLSFSFLFGETEE